MNAPDLPLTQKQQYEANKLVKRLRRQVNKDTCALLDVLLALKQGPSIRVNDVSLVAILCPDAGNDYPPAEASTS